MELSACRLAATRHATPSPSGTALHVLIFAILLALGGCGGGGDSGTSPPAGDGTPTNGGGGQTPSDTNGGGSTDNSSSPPPTVPSSGTHSGKPNADYADIPAAGGVVPSYTVFQIPAEVSLHAVDMSSTEVVGTTESGEGFRWSTQRGLRTTSAPPGMEKVFMSAINERGTALGYYGTLPYPSSPFLWHWNGTLVPINPSASMSSSLLLIQLPSDINDSDEAVGSFGYGDDLVNYRAVLRTPSNGWENIDAGPTEFPWSIGSGINNRGTVVGYAGADPLRHSEEVFHAFAWTRKAGMRDLGALPDGLLDQSAATAVNESGVIAGWTSGPRGSGLFRVPAKWDQAGNLLVLSTAAHGSATDLNDQSWIVGSLGRDGDYHGFVWERSVGLLSLSGMIAEPDSWSTIAITRAASINKYGEVAAEGDGSVYILTPYQLLYSRTDARDDPRPLEGSTFASSDRICVYLAPNFLVDKVRFSLDGTHRLEDDIKPFDLAGTADDYWCRLLDLSRLEPGQHSATATIQFDPAFQDGFRLASVTRTARFTIAQ